MLTSIVLTATVHRALIITYAQGTCLPTEDLEDYRKKTLQKMSHMSPSNREVIVQDNTNVDGSLQYKDM